MMTNLPLMKTDITVVHDIYCLDLNILVEDGHEWGFGQKQINLTNTYFHFLLL